MSLVVRPSRRFGTRSAQLFWRLPLIGRVRVPRNLAPLILAGAVGLAAGFAAVALTALIDVLTTLFDELESVLDGLAGGWTLMLVPAIAAIPVALVVSKIASETQGAGVPYVMVAVERAGGFVRPVIAPAKLIATGFTLGGGGAAGREGPIVLIAASLASTIGRLTKQPSDMLVLMVAAAAAGGIAATFHAPIAGTFFALEVVLRRFNVRNFTIVVCVRRRRQHRCRGVLRRLGRPRPARPGDQQQLGTVSSTRSLASRRRLPAFSLCAHGSSPRTYLSSSGCR